MFPSGWSSFKTTSSNETSLNSTMVLRESMGNYNYVALALLLIMQFFVTIGITTIPFMLTGEVYPFKYSHNLPNRFIPRFLKLDFANNQLNFADCVRCFAASQRLTDTFLPRFPPNCTTILNHGFHCLVPLHFMAS